MKETGVRSQESGVRIFNYSSPSPSRASPASRASGASPASPALTYCVRNRLEISQYHLRLGIRHFGLQSKPRELHQGFLDDD